MSLYLWWFYWVRQLQLLLPSLWCSVAFYNSLARSSYLSLFSPSFRFWSAGTAKSAPFESFHISWWSFCGVPVTAILLKFHSFFSFLPRSRSWLFTHWCFSHQRQLMVFHWSLSDSKFPQVYRTLLSIMAVLNNVVVWMVSTRPPTSKSSSPFSNPLVIVPNAPITIGIIVTFMFHSFFNSLARSRYLSFFSHSFSFILWSAGTAKATSSLFFFFFFFWLL